jgi:protocatechuate 3,4-dioxygenase beta subunit
MDRRKAIKLLAIACVKSTNVAAGPFFVDRDIPMRANLAEGKKGTPLVLRLRVGLLPDEAAKLKSGECAALAGAQVDVWHCDAKGIYSGFSQLGSNGRNFLRGYQLTDSAGEVTFKTIFPGWYPERTPHIHVKVRFPASGKTVTEATTQLFFEDAFTDSVYAANSAYARPGPRKVNNANDGLFSEEDPPLILRPEGKPGEKLEGMLALGIRQGEIHRG